MEPLDLRQAPPRPPREMLDGLMFLPRAIDIARAELPGGHIGDYQIGRGMSALLFSMLRLPVDDFREIVKEAKSEADVEAALRQRCDPLRYPKINAVMSGVDVSKVTPEYADDVNRFYSAYFDRSQNLFELIEIDDKETSR